jgi:hypothetical protein
MNSMLAGRLEFKPAIKVSPFSTVLKLAWTSNFPQKTGSRVKPGMTLFLGLMKRCFRAGVAKKPFTALWASAATVSGDLSTISPFHLSTFKDPVDPVIRVLLSFPLF